MIFYFIIEDHINPYLQKLFHMLTNAASLNDLFRSIPKAVLVSCALKHSFPIQIGPASRFQGIAKQTQVYKNDAADNSYRYLRSL